MTRRTKSISPREVTPTMSATEYVLVALTILIPAVIAVVVTLWTLEQARLRSRKNRKRPPRTTSDSATPPSNG
jgi:hypothetical protein